MDHPAHRCPEPENRPATASTQSCSGGTEFSYSTYLGLDRLLDLQQRDGVPVAADELVFMVMHQTHELIFRGVLSECDEIEQRLGAVDFASASQRLERLLALVRLLSPQLEVLATLRPEDFQRFRVYLGSASGMQSVQYWELQLALGDRSVVRCQGFPEGSRDAIVLDRRRQSSGLWRSFRKAVERCATQNAPRGFNGSTSSERWPDVLLELDPAEPGIHRFVEQLLTLDTLFQEWKFRHVKLVQRVLGMRSGTGGTSGSEYLARSVFGPLYPELWRLRAELAEPATPNSASEDCGRS